MLFQVSASHKSYFFEQFNLAFKYFLVHASFFAAMQSFSWYSRRICLVVSTDIKLDKSHSSITCLAVSFSWTFTVLINFHIIQWCSFRKWPHLNRFEKLPCALKLRDDFWDASSWNSEFLTSCSLTYILAHLHYFHLHFIRNFHHDGYLTDFPPCQDATQGHFIMVEQRTNRDLRVVILKMLDPFGMRRKQWTQLCKSDIAWVEGLLRPGDSL